MSNTKENISLMFYRRQNLHTVSPKLNDNHNQGNVLKSKTILVLGGCPPSPLNENSTKILSFFFESLPVDLRFAVLGLQSVDCEMVVAPCEMCAAFVLDTHLL